MAQQMDKETMAFIKDGALGLFKMIEDEKDAFDALDELLSRISKVIQDVANRGGLTETNAADYSFCSCAVAAILAAMRHNPIFENGVFSDQAMHHFIMVLRTAEATVVHKQTSKPTKEKG